MAILRFPRRPWMPMLPLLVLMLTGCAGAPRPVDALNQAQASIRRANETQAAQYAPSELIRARRLYQLAQESVRHGNNEQGGIYAAEAQADGDLARARAQLALVNQQVQSKRANNQALRTQFTQSQSASYQAPVPRLPASQQPGSMPAPAADMIDGDDADGAAFETVPQPPQGGQL